MIDDSIADYKDYVDCSTTSVEHITDEEAKYIEDEAGKYYNEEIPSHLYQGVDCNGNSGWFEDFEQSIGE